MQSGFNISPFSSRLSPHELAEEIRHRHNVSRYPVPVKSLAQSEGAVVKYAQILSDGSLAQSEKAYVIRVNQASHPYRQRFTIAHELGHMVLDRLSQKSFIAHRCPSRIFTAGEGEEQFCNRFASYLLIPDKAIAEFTKWGRISIQKLLRKAHELEVSISPLVWRVLEQAPYEGGALWFRMMGKPTDPKDVKLRLDWGVFPKSERMYLPRYDAVPKASPIHQALETSNEKLYKNVKVDFGSLRGRRTLRTKVIGQGVLAVVLPKEVDLNTILSDDSNFPALPIDIGIDLFGENQDGKCV